MFDARARRRRIACCMLRHRWVAAAPRSLALLLLESAAMVRLSVSISGTTERCEKVVYAVPVATAARLGQAYSWGRLLVSYRPLGRDDEVCAFQAFSHQDATGPNIGDLLMPTGRSESSPDSRLGSSVLWP